MENSNKILFYDSSSGSGGSANSLSNLINFLDKNKFCPYAAIKNHGSKTKNINKVEIIKLRPYQEPANLSYFKFLFYFFKNIIPEALKIITIIKKKRISLVHVNTNINTGMSVIIAARLTHIPCVCHIRQTRALIRRERLFSNWVDKFIVLNRYAFDMLKESIPENKIKIVYDGIDTLEFNTLGRGTARAEFNLNSNPIVGVIGRIIEGKGQREFILAAKEVLKTRLEVKFLVVGDARSDNESYLNQIKELIKNENMDSSVIFTGWRSDIINILPDLDILVLPSTTFPEGLPNTIIEAMALNKPVIATNIPGPSDIVIEGETGFLVPPSDINAMAEKIIYLINNPEIAKLMGEKGRKRVEELFDIKERVKDIEKIYAETLSSKQ